MFWKFWTDEEETGENDNSKGRCMARVYSVFNAAQVDGYHIPEIPDIPETERVASAETFFASTGAIINESGNRAFYRPSTDEITMLLFAHFKMASTFIQRLLMSASSGMVAWVIYSKYRIF